MTFRLSVNAPDLVELINRINDDEHRRAALLAAEFAIASSSLRDERADDAIKAVRAGRVGATEERGAVEALAMDLDDRQFDIHDKVEAGDATANEYLHAFRRARAASAVFFSGEPDARVAALEALYEASVVVDDLNDLRAALGAALATSNGAD